MKSVRPSKTIKLLFLAALGLSVTCTAASSTLEATHNEPPQTLPLWEWGVAGGAINRADYPGADEKSSRGLMFPYFIYRGESWRIGDGGVKGILVEDEQFEFDISIDGALDSNSEDNDARMGMPDLDFLIELGPQAIWKLGEVADGDLDLNIPVRAAIATDGTYLDIAGYVFNPKLTYRYRDQQTGRSGYSISAGLIFGDQSINAYFYQVNPAYQTEQRAAYQAKGGYIGSEISVGKFGKLTSKVHYFVGMQWANYSGSANSDSPLLKSNSNLGVALGLTYQFGESEKRVDSNRR